MILGVRPNKSVSELSSREKRLVIQVDLRVFVHSLQGGNMVTGRAMNLSSGGMYVASHHPLTEEEPVRLLACACEILPKDLELKGWVAHRSGEGMGIQFVDDDFSCRAMLLGLISRLRLGDG